MMQQDSNTLIIWKTILEPIDNTWKKIHKIQEQINQGKYWTLLEIKKYNNEVEFLD